MLSQSSSGMLEVFENGTTTTVVGVPSESVAMVWARTTDDTASVTRHTNAVTNKTTIGYFMAKSESVQLLGDLSLVDEPDMPEGVAVWGAKVMG